MAGLLFGTGLRRSYCLLDNQPNQLHAQRKLQYSTLLSPVEPRTKTGARRLAELAAGHQRFVTNQLANQKTSRVIESALGPEMCKAYMEELVFDFNPTDSPPWYDGSLSRLYRHFDRHPEPWKDGEQLLAIRQKLDVDKSRMFLERCAHLDGLASHSVCAWIAVSVNDTMLFF